MYLPLLSRAALGKMYFIQKKKKRKCHGRYIIPISVEQAPASLVSQYKCHAEGL